MSDTLVPIPNASANGTKLFNVAERKSPTPKPSKSEEAICTPVRPALNTAPPIPVATKGLSVGDAPNTKPDVVSFATCSAKPERRVLGVMFPISVSMVPAKSLANNSAFAAPNSNIDTLGSPASYLSCNRFTSVGVILAVNGSVGGP